MNQPLAAARDDIDALVRELESIGVCRAFVEVVLAELVDGLDAFAAELHAVAGPSL